MIDFSYGSKTFDLMPFTSKQQKLLGLYTALTQEPDLFKGLKILGFDATGLSENEQYVIAYKLKEISVGETTDIRLTCTSCHKKQDATIVITDIVSEPKIKDSNVKDLYKDFTEEDINLYTDVATSELYLSQYDEFKTYIQDRICKFNFIHEVKCPLCGAINRCNVKDVTFCLNALTNGSFRSIYQQYNDLIYYSHYTVTDIDGMFPFEREIAISMLMETMKRENENVKRRRQQQ